MAEEGEEVEEREEEEEEERVEVERGPCILNICMIVLVTRK